MHVWQLEAPSSAANEPPLQGMHAATETAAEVLLADPAGQAMHVATEPAPSFAEYVPAPHARQSDAFVARARSL